MEQPASKTVHLKLPTDLLEIVQAVALEQRRSVAQLIRFAVEDTYLPPPKKTGRR